MPTTRNDSDAITGNYQRILVNGDDWAQTTQTTRKNNQPYESAPHTGQNGRPGHSHSHNQLPIYYDIINKTRELLIPSGLAIIDAISLDMLRMSASSHTLMHTHIPCSRTHPDKMCLRDQQLHTKNCDAHHVTQPRCT